LTFTPPYPVPHKSKASLVKRFFEGWNSWIHTLFERSYTMKMGEIHLPRLDFYIANDLAIVDEVMDDKQRIYPKHEFLRELLDPLIGNSVFSANGKDWDNQREMVNPAFTHTNLKRVFPVMQQAVDDLVAQIRTLDLSKPVNVEPLMTHVAADIIFRTIFSVKLDAEGAHRIYTAFHRFQKYIQPSAMLRLYGLPCSTTASAPIARRRRSTACSPRSYGPATTPIISAASMARRTFCFRCSKRGIPRRPSPSPSMRSSTRSRRSSSPGMRPLPAP